MNSVADGNNILLQKITCSFCHHYLENPKILPQCRHVFCQSCVQSMDICLADSTSTRVTCSKCGSKSPLPFADADCLEGDAVLAKLVAEIKEKFSIMTCYRYNDSNRCLHLDLVRNPLKCLHCKQEYCEFCFERHKEKLQLELSWAASGFESRLEKVSAGKVLENRMRKIEDEVRQRHEEINSAVEKIERSFKLALEGYRQRAIEKVRKAADDEIAGVPLQVNQFSQMLQISSKVARDVAKKCEPMPINSVDRLAVLYDEVFQSDQEISELEDKLENPLLPSLNSCTPVFEAMLKDINNLEPSFLADPTNNEELPKLREAKRLREAAAKGDIGTVKSILERSNLPESCRRYAANYYIGHGKYDDFRFSPVMEAAKNGHLDVVRYLVLNHAAHLNDAVYYSEAINCAAACGHLEVTKFLVETARHDLTCSDFGSSDFGLAGSGKCVPKCKTRRFYLEDPIYCSVSSGHYDVARYLIANLDANNEPCRIDEYDEEEGTTLLHQAVLANKLDCVKFLVEEAGASIDAYSRYGMTALQYAAAEGYLDIVRYLVEHGASTKRKTANVFHLDFKTQTAEQCALDGGHLDIVEYLSTKQ